MSDVIYVFEAGDGEGLPRLVAEARLVNGVIECADESYRRWLDDGVWRVRRDHDVPREGPELTAFIVALCAERSGSRVFASPFPIL
ncbi:MAG: hypothetical protein IPG45_25360 [Deltaproteobacteria bacterium]|nr:hypothetical protein [Deltaproteobacteria bacterium]